MVNTQREHTQDSTSADSNNHLIYVCLRLHSELKHNTVGVSPYLVSL